MAWIIALSLTIIYFLNLGAILAMIFRRRDEPIYIIAWTMIMTFIPFLGFIFYLLFGHGPNVKEKKTFIDKLEATNYQTAVDEQRQRIQTTKEEKKSYQSLIDFNLNYNHSILTGWNDVQLFFDAKEKYPQLLEDLEKATETIHILYFIIRDDESGRALIQTLAKKAKEGVKVRLVYDGGGSFMTPQSYFKPLLDAGGVVVKHYPAKFKIFTLNWNYRNHRKIVVIDGKVGYMGGMNIGDEYLSLNPKFQPWRDAHLKVEGEMVPLLQMRFLKDYFMVMDDELEINQMEQDLDRYFPTVTCQQKMKVQVVSDGPDQQTDHMRAAYIKLIMSARERILIQSPYFIPDSEFLHVLKIAAFSGVDVKIMIPVIPDNHFVHRTTTSYIKELLEAGIEVYFYEGFLHSKIIVIDQEFCTMGSVNMDVRSFSINFEISAFIYDEQIAKSCCDQFAIDQENCRLLDFEYEKQKSKWIKAEESIYRLVSMLM